MLRRWTAVIVFSALILNLCVPLEAARPAISVPTADFTSIALALNAASPLRSPVRLIMTAIVTTLPMFAERTIGGYSHSSEEILFWDCVGWGIMILIGGVASVPTELPTFSKLRTGTRAWFKELMMVRIEGRMQTYSGKIKNGKLDPKLMERREYLHINVLKGSIQRGVINPVVVERARIAAGRYAENMYKNNPRLVNRIVWVYRLHQLSRLATLMLAFPLPHTVWWARLPALIALAFVGMWLERGVLNRVLPERIFDIDDLYDSADDSAELIALRAQVRNIHSPALQVLTNRLQLTAKNLDLKPEDVKRLILKSELDLRALAAEPDLKELVRKIDFIAFYKRLLTEEGRRDKMDMPIALLRLRNLPILDRPTDGGDGVYGRYQIQNTVGELDRGLAEEYEFPHPTANGYADYTDKAGKKSYIVRVRGPAEIEPIYPGAVSLFGGHVLLGEKEAEAMRSNFCLQMGLPLEGELTLKDHQIENLSPYSWMREGYSVPGDRNKESRAFFVAHLTPGQFKYVGERSKRSLPNHPGETRILLDDFAKLPVGREGTPDLWPSFLNFLQLKDSRFDPRGPHPNMVQTGYSWLPPFIIPPILYLFSHLPGFEKPKDMASFELPAQREALLLRGS